MQTDRLARALGATLPGMFPPSQGRAELQIVDVPVGAQRTHRHYRDRLGGTLASDDIRLPFVGVDVRTREPLEGG
ncbi:MAG TPA: hypothetical protein VFH16_21530 [Rubrobacter sp.]|nr:hypothetical protein [Rubrobacter sp.]